MIISINRNSAIIILYLILLSLHAVSAEFNGSEILSPALKDVKIESESFFNVKIISPELLDQLKSNIGANDEVLKIAPGVVIGILTPGVLYIRGDFNNEAYLKENRDTSDMKTAISKHLVDIAFGKDSANLSLRKSDLDYQFWFQYLANSPSLFPNPTSFQV